MGVGQLVLDKMAVSCSHWEYFSFCSAMICLFPQRYAICKHLQTTYCVWALTYRRGLQRKIGSSPCPQETSSGGKMDVELNQVQYVVRATVTKASAWGGPHYPCLAGPGRLPGRSDIWTESFWQSCLFSLCLTTLHTDPLPSPTG